MPSPQETPGARKLRLRLARLVTSLFAGEYRSAFRGRGIEFEDLREYHAGDDIRDIDWNVTARSHWPFVKRYVEEREITLILVLDRSPSLSWPAPRKQALASEVCALLAQAAQRSNDRVGLLVFTDQVETYLPPKKGGRHLQRLIEELERPRAGQGSDLAGALDYLVRVQRRPAIFAIVSDFQVSEYRLPLLAAVRRHDVLAIIPTLSLDDDLPDVGLVRLTDSESGSRTLVDSGDALVRVAYRREAARHRQEIYGIFADAGIDAVAIAGSPAQALMRFFNQRARRRR